MSEAIRQPVYLFEGFRLDSQRRILYAADGQPISLTPRLFDTLLYFVERAGQLLPKERLLEDLWPNVVVEEHNLNKTISELRRVLGEKRGEHRFIVTKPGRGYRFVADVAIESRSEAEIETLRRPGPVHDTSATVVAAVPTRDPSPQAPRLSIWIAATLAIVVVAAGLALVRNRAFGPPELELPVTSWSAERGGQRSPVWSPDGRTTAFVARARAGAPSQLYVRELGSSVSRAIYTFSDAALGSIAQWSSDGKILFWDRTEAGSGLWSVSPVGAGVLPELVAAVEFDINLYGPLPDRVMDVTRDGTRIAAIGRTADGMVGVFTATLPGAKFERYTPDTFAAHGIFNGIFLRFSPDGKQLLLWWNAARGETEAWLLPFPADVSRVPRRVLEDVPPAFTGGEDFSWLPDNRHVVVSAGPGPPRTLYLADTVSGRYRRLSSGPNRPNAQVVPVVSPDGDKVLYIERRYDFDIMTLDLLTATVKDEIATDSAEQTPAWAARAHLLVYGTFRSGAGEIWLHEPPLPDRPLVTARNFDRPTQGLWVPALSPDGARVVYHRVEGTSIESAYLWMSAVEGSAPQRLTNGSDVELGGVWSPDGAWVAYFAGSGAQSLMKAKTTGQAEPQMLLKHAPSHGWLPAWSPDGKWILLSGPGLLVAADGSGETRDLGIALTTCVFALAEPLLYCIRAGPKDDEHALVLMDFDGNVVRNIGAVAPDNVPATGVRPGLRLSPTPDGTGVTYAVNRSSDNLWLMESLSSVPRP